MNTGITCIHTHSGVISPWDQNWINNSSSASPAVVTADMRLPSNGIRVRRAAESSEAEPEEGTEPAHHEHSHTEHHEHHEHHEHSHPEHHPGHDYKDMKEKFMNELGHLPSETLRHLTDLWLWLFVFKTLVYAVFIYKSIHLHTYVIHFFLCSHSENELLVHTSLNW